MRTARFPIFLCTQRDQTHPAKKGCCTKKPSDSATLQEEALPLPSSLPASHWGENTQYWGWEARGKILHRAPATRPCETLIFAGTKQLRDTRGDEPSAGGHPLLPPASRRGAGMRCKSPFCNRAVPAWSVAAGEELSSFAVRSCQHLP